MNAAITAGDGDAMADERAQLMQQVLDHQAVLIR
jgi:hypothetical protein